MKKYLYILFVLLSSIFLILLYIYFLNIRASKLQISCPVPAEYCSRGQVLERNGGYFAIGYKLPLNTPIFAVLDGYVKGGRSGMSTSAGHKIYPNLILVTNNPKYNAFYVITGDDYLETKAIKAGEIITGARKDEIGDFKEINLIFYLTRDTDENKREKVFLQPKDFNK